MLMTVFALFVSFHLLVNSSIKAETSVDHTTVIADLMETVKENPNAIRAHCDLANAYVDQYISTGKTNKLLLFRAKKAIKKAEMIDAKSALPQISWANYFLAMGNKEWALKHAKNAAAIAPENKAVKRLLTELGGQTQNRFVEQLADCKVHLKADRLTTGTGGTGGTALDCYRAVLKEDPNNKQALSGIDQIAEKYVQWIENAIRQNKERSARRYIEKLSIVKPVHPQIVSYNEKVDSLSAALQKAKTQSGKSKQTTLRQLHGTYTSSHPQIVSYNEKIDSLSAARQKSKTQSVKSKQATVRQGHGNYLLPDGTRYVGNFKDGNFNGQGTKTWPSGKKYVGEWKNGKKHGHGVFSWLGGHKYVGQWKDDEKHGTGIYTWPSGEKYVGQYKNDKKHGTGTLIWPSGSKYVGQYKDGKQHGTGTLIWSSGDKYVGAYENGRESGGWYYDKSSDQKTWSYRDSNRKWVNQTSKP